MRKTAAILFLTLFLFNLAGYRCWVRYLQQKDQTVLESRLDKDDYNEGELIRFTVPLSMPYQLSWSDFERVDGEVTINGIIYKYVKRKVENGQLILLCLPNYKKMRLEKASSEFGSHGNGILPTSRKPGNASSEKIASLNEFEAYAKWSLSYRSSIHDREYPLFLLSSLPHDFIAAPGKPPKFG